MGFWDTTDGTNVKETDGSFEAGGGAAPIPDGTSVLAACDEASWAEYGGSEYINLRWNVLQPAEYKGRKVFHKVRVKDSDSKRRDKALRMLAAIDANAGGNLVKIKGEPSDSDLAKHLMNKPMVLKLAVWEMDADDGSKKTGNWVMAVSPRKGAAKPEPAPVAEEVEDDDLPF